MKHIYKPYTYKIGWSFLNLWYFGVRYSKEIIGREPEEDFWKHYFTSSEIVSDFRNYISEPDVMEIVEVFDNREDALAAEKSFLSSVNAKDNIHWLNGSNGYGTCNFVPLQNTVSCTDVTSGKSMRVPKEVYDSSPNLVGVGIGNKKNKGTVACIDTRTGNKQRVSKEEFDACDYLVGITKGKSNPFDHSAGRKTNKGKVPVKNIITGERKVITKEEFWASTEWVHANRKHIT